MPADHLLKKIRTKKFKETGDWRYIYQNRLDKGCVQHNMAYGDFKVLPRRLAFDKLLRVKHLILLKILLRDKAFDISKNLKYDGYQKGLGSMVYKCFNKCSGANTLVGAFMWN